MAAKAAFRLALKEQRDALTRHERRGLSQQICAHAQALPCLQSPGCVALYAPIGSEVETYSLATALRQRGIRIAYPRCDASTLDLSFVAVSDNSELSPGYRSIPEPQGRPCALPEIEAIVVPGLAFDKKGGRIGYGAGYYDRTLSVYPGVTIGLAYDFQVVSTLPQASHDAPMDWIITPAGALEIAEASAGGVVL